MRVKLRATSEGCGFKTVLGDVGDVYVYAYTCMYVCTCVHACMYVSMSVLELGYDDDGGGSGGGGDKAGDKVFMMGYN